MKKTLTLLAILAAIGPAWGADVVSSNIVGYNKVTLTKGYNMLSPMMEMFRQLKLQLILIATPEKCTSIYPYCDVTYSIIKQGSRNAIASFEEVK